AVDLAPAWPLKSPVSLSSIKSEPSLKDILLVRVGRLSVLPLEKEQFETIVSMGGGKAKLA
ncbi:MAG TPA: EVE domain-containing protein, partial [Spirochaetia bacterium]|nr:EVE domain-containing protein [Spirochaetia bacterium]